MTNLDYSHAGNYSCRVGSGLDSVTKTFELIMISKPKVKKFSPVVMNFTDHLKVDCKASNNPSKYEWSLNEEIVSHSKTLEINEKFTSGLIKCNASNKAGYSIENFRLIIVRPPELTSMNHNSKTEITLKENEDIELKCPIKNHGKMQWFLNSLENVVEKESKIYRIKKASPYDSRKHICVGSNRLGSVSFTFDVKVLSKPEAHIYRKQKSDSKSIVGAFMPYSDLLLECENNFHSDGENYTWFKNGLIISHQNQLHLSKITDDFNGDYICRITNSEGSSETSINIVVAEKIQINEFKRDESEKNVKSIFCIVSGYPMPKVVILNEYQKQINANTAIKIGNNNTLRVEARLPLSDINFKFFCRAYNETTEVIRELVVGHQKSFLEFNDIRSEIEIEAFKYESVNLDCSASGFPDPMYSWKVENGSFPSKFNSQSNSVEIVNKFGQTVDIFICEVTNGQSDSLNKKFRIRTKSPWSESKPSECSTKCDPGHQKLVLTCIDPSLKACSGKKFDVKFQYCNKDRPCPKKK